MKSLRKFTEDTNADAKMIGTVIGIFITLIIAILVFYNIMASIDTTSIDANINISSMGANGNNQTPAANSTTGIVDQSETFFAVAPIIGIVIVAVVILGYVSRIGG